MSSTPFQPQLAHPVLSTAARLYVTNLPSSKIQKNDLKTALYMLFSTYGPVLDVVCLKTAKMRGQAHVVFRDIQAATQAMRSLEGFVFLGQALVSLQLGALQAQNTNDFVADPVRQGKVGYPRQA